MRHALSSAAPVGAVLLVLFGLSGLECSDSPPPPHAGELILTSPSFWNGEPVPETYTCMGSGIAPPLKWSGVPSQTKSIALTLEKVRPDETAPERFAPPEDSAGVDGPPLLWLLYNLPPDLTSLAEGYTVRSPEDTQADEFVHALNFFGTRGYDGPCPATGKPATYVFRVFALQELLSLDHDASASQVRRAMDDLIIGQGELSGTYGYAVQQTK